MAKISLIAAIGATTRALGKNNTLLWHLPEDLKYFRDTTRGHAVIMGRKTYESIGKPLPNRTNIVVTRTATYKAEGCKVVTSLDDALKYAKALTNSGADEVFVIGGADIYTQALPHAERLYLTLVDDPGEGADVFFPEYEKEFTKVIAEETSESGGMKFRRVTLER
jgi:dihydrofolate reductase